jgi:hypothetical protein
VRKSVVIFVQNNEVPHIASYETHQRPQEISIVIPKRLLQQYLPGTEVAPLFDHLASSNQEANSREPDQQHRQAGASVLRRDPFGGNTQLRVFGTQKQFPATAYQFATTENATICAV